LLRKVDYHQNIIHFYGITKKEGVFKIDFYFDFLPLTKIHIFILLDNGNGKYLLVLEYADSGTLRNYLQQNSKSIDWDLKLKFAYEIASAILCLHENNIVHRDLVTTRLSHIFLQIIILKQIDYI